jgi:quercetin dioxygenase-like cupin family protein
MKERVFLFAVVALAVVMIMIAPANAAAQAQQAAPKPVRTVLQKLDDNAMGREISLVMVEFAPGAAEVPHTHPGPYVARVMEGAFEFDVAGKPTTTYRTGDTFAVDAGQAHHGKNVAEGKTLLLITFVLPKGVPPSTPVK